MPALSIASLACAATPPSKLKTYRDFAARRDGNSERGRIVFFAADKAGCALCHSVDGSNAAAGPDLSAIGDKLGRRELIEAVLEPNAAIAVGYESTLVETVSGETYYGVVKVADAAVIELMGADRVRVRRTRADVKSMRPSPTSLMPENLHTALTAQEFTDLIDYLASQKQLASAGASHRGTPDVIPEVTKSISLRPLLSDHDRFADPVARPPGAPRLGLVWFGEIPGRDSFLAAHQSGTLWLMEKNGQNDVKTLFADFTSELYSRTGPNGLLGVAFHPAFAQNRKYYLKHQVFENDTIASVLVEKIAREDLRGDSGAPSRRLLTIPCVTQNHTGGCIEFGPDGFLYLGMGDTGPQEDPNGHGQNMQLLLGKILRLDVDRRSAALPYAIPSDNPFRNRAGVRPEIWALGFREPWRFSFDPQNGDLWVGDVGQYRVEEVAIVRPGENHGWNVYEGYEPFSNQHRAAGQDYVAPVLAYKRHYGNSVTGGYVYRGDARSPFYGVYVFGDYTSKRIFGLTQRDGRLETVRQIGTSPESIASFGRDRRGNLYLVGYEGMIYQLDFTGADFAAAVDEAANARAKITDSKN